MRNSALSIANYFIKKAHEEGSQIKPLRLMKLVYIAHGYMLAILNRSALNPRFDKVEAWKYGPVIPSVYHSFKQYGNGPIEKQTVIIHDEKVKNGNCVVDLETPMLEGKEEKAICDVVWKNYKGYSDSELVTMLHKDGSPWALVYVEGQNIEIPDLFTRIYYTKVINSILKANGSAERI